jgi:hypothetical protein
MLRRRTTRRSGATSCRKWCVPSAAELGGPVWSPAPVSACHRRRTCSPRSSACKTRSLSASRHCWPRRRVCSEAGSGPQADAPFATQTGAQPAAGDKALTELRGRILAAQEELASGLIERDAEVSCSVPGPRQACSYTEEIPRFDSCCSLHSAGSTCCCLARLEQRRASWCVVLPCCTLLRD